MDIPDLQQGAWRFCDLADGEEVAAARFTARYGVPPEYIVEDGRYLYYGPVPEQSANVANRNTAERLFA